MLASECLVTNLLIDWFVTFTLFPFHLLWIPSRRSRWMPFIIQIPEAYFISTEFPVPILKTLIHISSVSYAYWYNYRQRSNRFDSDDNLEIRFLFELRFRLKHSLFTTTLNHLWFFAMRNYFTTKVSIWVVQCDPCNRSYTKVYLPFYEDFSMDLIKNSS